MIADAQIRPVQAGVTFRFRIYFENLRDFELGALLWALTLPGEPGKDYCHSLGMGKPLGMGAVKITPTLSLSDRQSRYTRLFTDADWQRGETQETDIERFIKALEDFVLKGMDAHEPLKLRLLECFPVQAQLLHNAAHRPGFEVFASPVRYWRNLTGLGIMPLTMAAIAAPGKLFAAQCAQLTSNFAIFHTATIASIQNGAERSRAIGLSAAGKGRRRS